MPGSIDANNKPADEILGKALAIITGLSEEGSSKDDVSINNIAALSSIPDNKNIHHFADDFLKKQFNSVEFFSELENRTTTEVSNANVKKVTFAPNTKER